MAGKVQKQTNTARMTDEQTLKFVRLYREHENLWNIFLPDYRNRDARSSALQALVKDMNLDNFQAKDVAKKVKSLRCTYYLEQAKIEKSKRSGGSTDFVYTPTLPWFNDMDYIINIIKTKDNETEDNLEIEYQASENQQDVEQVVHEKTDDMDDDENGSVHNETLSPIKPSKAIKGKYNQQRKTGIKTSKKNVGPIHEALKELKDLNKILLDPPATYQDECEIMGKQIAAQLRALPELSRLRANLEIQRILLDFRVEQINSTSPQSVELTTSNCSYTVLDVIPPSTSNSHHLHSSNEVLDNSILTKALASSKLQFLVKEDYKND